MAETKNFLDLTGVGLLWSKIKLLLADKVDKETGKGLSSNDYTSDEKTKLANVATGAQVNVLEGIQKNGTTVTVTNKIANIEVPTKTSDLTNDSNFAVDANYTHTDNNYTTAEKNKLSAIEASADVNVIETVKVNGTALTPDANKAVDVAVPTKTSDITNDSGFITTADIPEGAAASTTVPLMDGTAAVGTELAFARGDHRHPSDTTKVDKVTGKGLSTNDFTDALKDKLDAIDEEANKYELPTATASVLGGIKVGSNLSIDANGVLSADAQHIDVDSAMSASSTNPVQNKVINTALGLKAPLASPALTGTPTAPTAAAGTNTTQIATTAFVTSAVSTAIGDLAGVEFSIVNALPAAGDASIIYLVSASDGSGNDVYDEYIWLSANTAFEKIGTTRVDLSDYYNTSNMIPITSAQIDAVCV